MRCSLQGCPEVGSSLGGRYASLGLAWGISPAVQVGSPTAIDSWVLLRMNDSGGCKGLPFYVDYHENRRHSLPLYIALSRCWGKTGLASARTIKELGKHTELIDVHLITITRRIKLKYVWGDSLCITSLRQTTGNIGKPKWLYSYTHITISASGSADRTVGCRVWNEHRSYGLAGARLRRKLNVSRPQSTTAS